MGDVQSTEQHQPGTFSSFQPKITDISLFFFRQDQSFLSRFHLPRACAMRFTVHTFSHFILTPQASLSLLFTVEESRFREGPWLASATRFSATEPLGHRAQAWPSAELKPLPTYCFVHQEQGSLMKGMLSSVLSSGCKILGLRGKGELPTPAQAERP